MHFHKHKSTKNGFKKDLQKIFCCDSLQGILLIFRRYPSLQDEIKMGLLVQKEVSEKLANDSMAAKVNAILKLIVDLDFSHEESIEEFLKQVTNAGNFNIKTSFRKEK